MIVLARVQFGQNLSKLLVEQEQSEADERQARTSRGLRRPLYACNRWLLVYLARLHRMDIMRRTQLSERLTYLEKLILFLKEGLWLSSSNSHEQQLDEGSFTRPKFNRAGLVWLLHRARSWPNVALLVYLAHGALVGLNVLLQYAYDYVKIRLNQLLVHLHDPEMRQQLAGRYELAKYQALLEWRLDLLRAALKLLGAPHLEWAVVVEIIYSYALFASFFAYFIGPLWCKMQGAVYYPMVRYLLDQGGEMRHRAELMRAEVNKIVESSRSFTESQLNLKPEQLAPVSAGRCATSASIERHSLTIKQLQTLALTSRLRPINRELGWLDTCVLLSINIALFMYIYTPICMWLLYSMVERFYSSHGKPVELDTWRDVNLFVGSALLLVVIVNSATFYGIINILNVSDQIHLVSKVKQLISNQMHHNECRARRLLEMLQHRRRCRRRRQHESEQASFRPELAAGRQMAPLSQVSKQTSTARDYGLTIALIHQIDLDLLNSFVQYRVFSEEYRRVKRTFDAYAIGFLISVTSLPLITRALLPYVDPELNTFAFALSFVAMWPTFAGLAPLCHLHCRCIDTYKALSSLLAQLTCFETNQQLQSCLNFEHSIVMLRKELAHSDLFSRKFAASTTLADITYANLLKIFFWLSLILLSLLRDRGDKGDLISRVLNDPFGVTNF